jgi:predicted MFS family arabinose efflux permease
MPPKSKLLLYILTFLNCYSTVYYSNFLFFYMKSHYQFGELQNLLLAALYGFVYIIFAWLGGKFSQRYGGILCMAIGFAGMGASLFSGLFISLLFVQIVVFAVWTACMCFTWPAIEALISENGGNALSDLIGWFNITWATSSAIAYFTAGILLETIGMKSIFWFPALLCCVQFACVIYLMSSDKERGKITRDSPGHAVAEAPSFRSRRFLHMAWIANPFSYVAVNTLIPLIPSIAGKMGLSTAGAGVVCSVWQFARLGFFFLLRRWRGWQYRFVWLATSFILLIVCFTGMLYTRNLLMLLVFQIIFGMSVGLIYYSSLFYSMNTSQEKTIGGGFHETMIGAGLFAGPAFGALSCLVFPVLSGMNAIPVSGLLVVGCAGMLWMGKGFMKLKVKS